MHIDLSNAISLASSPDWQESGDKVGIAIRKLLPFWEISTTLLATVANGTPLSLHAVNIIWLGSSICKKHRYASCVQNHTKIQGKG